MRMPLENMVTTMDCVLVLFFFRAFGRCAISVSATRVSAACMHCTWCKTVPSADVLLTDEGKPPSWIEPHIETGTCGAVPACCPEARLDSAQVLCLSSFTQCGSCFHKKDWVDTCLQAYCRNSVLGQPLKNKIVRNDTQADMLGPPAAR